MSTLVGQEDGRSRVVFDTNVLVSALLKPGSVPDRALELVWAHACLTYHRDLLVEYGVVLARSRLGIAETRRDQLLERIRRDGVELAERVPFGGVMPDEDDRMFVEVALSATTSVLCTGNLRHYPVDVPVRVVTPAMLLVELGG